MNTHRGVSNRLVWMQATFRLGEETQCCRRRLFSFDVSVWEFFWPLMTGAKLVMARAGGHRDADYLIEVIKEQG